MIPVVWQAEPVDFDEKVRQPGKKWLVSHEIALDSTPPKASDLPNYWTHSNYQLWKAYSGTCAYLAIFFEWATGAASTDHFVAKSVHAGDAYEWSNYRLSCLGPNRNKGRFDDVLDPIGLHSDTFVLNLTNGEISQNPSLGGTLKADVKKTISRLKLDSFENNRMRAKHYVRYLRKKDEVTLKELSPFVWYEAKRQDLL